MEENNIETKMEQTEKDKKNGSQQQIAGAIILAGLIIAGAILLKDTVAPPNSIRNANEFADIKLAKVSETDIKLGNPKAKVDLIVYEDYQCPFCGAVSGLVPDSGAIKYLKQKIDPDWEPFVKPILDTYVKDGKVQFVYRDWEFLGAESIQAAEAARCAGDQGKYWEYHDYLYTHQNGENQGAFADKNLKSFAKKLGLESTTFDTCLDGNKYSQAVTDSKTTGTIAGVSGTPKGFILRDGKIVDIINGAESFSTVKSKIDNALK